MKITLTGSLGRIGKPLTKYLAENDDDSVTVISSTPEREKEIKALGATSAIGSVEDVSFLTDTFKNADAAYCMIPPNAFFNPDLDTAEYCREIARNYTKAIQQSDVTRVVLLSSIGAHTDKGNGILGVYYPVEAIFSALPDDVSVTFIRPVGFYHNLLGFIETIKNQGVIASNYGGDDKNPWVSPIDIADAIAEEITVPQPAERKVQYVASEELTCNEIASILGDAIGKPDLEWVLIPDEQVLQGMIDGGMNPDTAKGFVEMNSSIHSGEIYEDYYQNRPSLGNVKMTDFAKEFAAIYNQQ